MTLRLIALAFLLSGCDPLSATGARPDARPPMPAVARVPCPHPSTLLDRRGTVAADAVSVLRLGDALIDCDGRRALAVSAYDEDPK